MHAITRNVLIFLSWNSLLCGFIDRKREEAFLSQFFKEGDLVFDIGANVGRKSMTYTKMGARVIAVEPQPECCEKIHVSCAGKNIVVVAKGVAHQEGTLPFKPCINGNTLSTFSEEWATKSRYKREQWGAWEYIPVTTLDALIAEYGMPQFCKIDVENFEYPVLCGLSQPIPYLSFEFAMEVFHNTEKCIARLIQLGYRKFNFTTGFSVTFELDDWVDGDNILEEIKRIVQENRMRTMSCGDLYAAY